MGEIVFRMNEIDANKRICLYCKTRKRAEVVANLLETDYNYKNILVVDGGVMSYEEKI